MRGRVFNWPAIGRAAAFIVAAAAMIVIVVYLRGDPASAPDPQVDVTIRTDPLAQALAHCQAIGAAAESDAVCEAAWAENRRRFFTYRTPTQAAAVRSPSISPTKDK